MQSFLAMHKTGMFQLIVPAPSLNWMGLLRMGRLSILLMSRSRSANTLSALNSCPGPSGTENTTLVLKSEAPDLAAQHRKSIGEQLRRHRNHTVPFDSCSGAADSWSLEKEREKQTCCDVGALTCDKRLSCQGDESAHVGLPSLDVSGQYLQPIQLSCSLTADRCCIPALPPPSVSSPIQIGKP